MAEAIAEIIGVAVCASDRIRQVKIAFMGEIDCRLKPAREDDRDPTVRFSDRVDDYVKYRPEYSPQIIEALRQACGLRPEHLIADVGCGTGMLAKIFLGAGNRVIGVEPNREMRVAGESYLADYPAFDMIEGTAEGTNLDSASIDFVAAAQAFHWFRPDETRAEFARVLKPGGWVVLIWHDRDTEANDFLRAYEDFLRRYSTDYDRVAHKYLASYPALEGIFAPNRLNVIVQRSQQCLDLVGLRGRLLSSSYIPNKGDRYEAMIAALPSLFTAHGADGQVVLEYNTCIYYGHLDQ
jgi:SAM-dependent methyltransferase